MPLRFCTIQTNVESSVILNSTKRLSFLTAVTWISLNRLPGTQLQHIEVTSSADLEERRLSVLAFCECYFSGCRSGPSLTLLRDTRCIQFGENLIAFCKQGPLGFLYAGWECSSHLANKGSSPRLSELSRLINLSIFQRFSSRNSVDRGHPFDSWNTARTPIRHR